MIHRLSRCRRRARRPRSCRPLGISIVGGLIVSQMLTLYTTPVIYLYLDRFRLWWRGARSVAHA